MKTTTIVTIEAAQVGQGRDLVMLHSLLTDRSAFDRILPRLAARRRVTLLNLPGFGTSSQVEAGIWNYADWVARAFDELKLPSETAILGNGFGGSVAIAFAARYGRRLERLVLADAAAIFPDQGREAFRSMAAQVEQNGMGSIVEVAVRRLFTEDYIASHPHLLDACRSVLLRTNPEAFVTACRTLASMDLRPALAEIDHEVLVVAGEHDAATPAPTCRALAAALPRAQYCEIADCAHAPQIQKPEVFLESVEPFLEQVELNRPGFAGDSSI